MSTPSEEPDSTPPCPLDIDSEVKRLSRLIGQSPDPTTGRNGAGLLGVVSTIHTDVKEIRAAFDAMVMAQNRRRALATKLALMALVPTFAAIVAAVAHFLGGLHR